MEQTNMNKPSEQAMKAAEIISNTFIDEQNRRGYDAPTIYMDEPAIARIIESEMGDVVELRKLLKEALDALNQWPACAGYDTPEEAEMASEDFSPSQIIAKLEKALRLGDRS